MTLKISHNLKDNFKAAFHGLRETLIFERNFKIMLAVSALVVFGMFYFKTNWLENAILLTTIFSILTLELINVVIERILNFLQPEYDEKIRIIKDLMASIVLIASSGAIIIGLLIFGQYLR